MRGNLLVLAASVAIMCLGLELGLRAITPKSPPGTTYGRPVSMNSMGCRDREFAVPKPSGTYRIVVLGDSFTWGIGLDPEETLPKLLEERLGATSPGLEVVNASVLGQNTVQELETLRRVGLRYEPDMVVLLYCMNDVDLVAPPAPDTSSAAAAAAGARPVDESVWDPDQGLRGLLFRVQVRSKLVGFLVPRVGDVLRRAGLLRSVRFSWVEKTFQSYVDENPGWRESKRALGEIAAICRERGIPMVVGIYPFFSQLDRYRGGEAHRAVRAACDGLGIPVVDFLPLFESRDPARFRVNFMDTHPSAEAHQLAAEAIFPFVRARIAIDPGS